MNTNRQINILNELFTGRRGSDACTPDELHRVQFAADVVTNRLDAVDADDVTVADGRRMAKSLIELLETINTIE